GILATAMKRGALAAEHSGIATAIMATLNKAGMALAAIDGVHAMTDVTGFGLLGHLIELCEGSGLRARLDFDAVPVIPEARRYLAQGCYPDGSFRNWKSYGAKAEGASSLERMMLLSDPQTSGGLLVACAPDAAADALAACSAQGGGTAVAIGELVPEDEGPVVLVR
ncbi:MAG: selenide, water dikinase SelD, partial [Flavobacteriales bacterium]